MTLSKGSKLPPVGSSSGKILILPILDSARESSKGSFPCHLSPRDLDDPNHPGGFLGDPQTVSLHSWILGLPPKSKRWTTPSSRARQDLPLRLASSFLDREELGEVAVLPRSPEIPLAKRCMLGKWDEDLFFSPNPQSYVYLLIYLLINLLVYLFTRYTYTYCSRTLYR